MGVRVVRAAELRAVAIGDSGNTTTELFIDQPGATLAAQNYDVRISTAHLLSGGPFSKIFAGYTRILMLLSGHGLGLEIYDLPCDASRANALAGPGKQCTFSGDVRVESTLIDGPVRDINVIFRPGRVSVASAVLRCCADRSETVSLAYAVNQFRQVDVFYALGKYRLIIAGQRTECDSGDVVIVEEEYATIIVERRETAPVAHAQIVLLNK